MTQETRPTCISVIGWAWIIIGGLMTISALFALIGFMMMPEEAMEDPNVPMIFNFIPVIIIFQIAFSLIGIYSGINFLKLRQWARSVLEIQTWILLVFTSIFMIYWIYSWVGLSSEIEDMGFSILGAVMGLVMSAVYIVPLIIMLRYLRGDKVKKAINIST